MQVAYAPYSSGLVAATPQYASKATVIETEVEYTKRVDYHEEKRVGTKIELEAISLQIIVPNRYLHGPWEEHAKKIDAFNQDLERKIEDKRAKYRQATKLAEVLVLSEDDCNIADVALTISAEAVLKVLGKLTAETL